MFTRNSAEEARVKIKQGKKCSFDGVKSSLYNPIASDFPLKKFIANSQDQETQFASLFPSDASYIESNSKRTDCK